ncbi:hypothetical protein ACFP3U_23035 [Kitasatospora misakiensis]|uniref:Gram-positive cocci surface proteins LPxTG domain-containing protein n=1 Tax=Kitasatospora misakiensis TaxID=67330 RepID=A0ABW0X9K9_9ACTN
MPAPSSSSAFLGPLPAALPPHPSRRRSGRARRLLGVAVFGLAVPLVIGPVAVAAPAGVGAVPVPVASPEPSAPSDAPSDAPSPEASARPMRPSAGADPGPEAVPEESSPEVEPSTAATPSTTASAWQSAAPGRSGPSWAGWEQRRYRHRPASAPERPESAPEGAPDLGRAQAAERTPERTPERRPERSAEAGVDAAGPVAGPQGGTSAAPDSPGAPGEDFTGETLALGLPGQQTVTVGPVVLPTRWDDAATRQLPLGAGLGLIGCGLGLIGLRLRRD